MNIDIGRSVTYPFEDREWFPKTAVLLIIGLIPGLNLIVWGGYAITIARNLYHGEPHPLPDWAEWSDIAVRGLLSIVATLLYYLPVLLLGCCVWVAGLFLGGRNTVGGALLPIQCCGAALGITYVLVAQLLLGVGHVRFVQSDQFYRYVDFARRIQDLRAEPSLFVTLLVYQLLVSLIGIGVALLLAITCIGGVAVLTMMFLANGYILGLAANAARKSSRLPQMSL